ncbi:NAD-dependent epimerase/dehydratase family protein [Arthrobacter sp. B3I4]|uniref:NAD-dependent epimerase/dehydratase family protein n=1 Tax=Arthrobacter sp. B3I4 TaxID=3042267 RepID=UPI00277F4E1F|nr:NAD-dependent epimerase/dehydratase family protein [Arthrobacter sp. B3I4]MDQ0756155.1 2'-hydroxyisoflavone reductase [Arthrobacter sp. B3I4]
MRILVLGGTAFLSAEIARQALAAGHDVLCLARGTGSAPPEGATWLKADRSLGPSAYDAAVAAGEWDAVIDVAREPRFAVEALEALAGSARHWTFVSSCSVYADHSVPGAAEDAALLPPLAASSEATAENYGEAKSAIEHATAELAADKAHLCRAGLIGGPGDGSDRYGYWPARFARDAAPVLAPDIPADATQIIDVRDLAAWLLAAAASGVTGALNAVGEPVPFADYLEESRQVAGAAAEVVPVPANWLVAHGVNYWAGPESLPLWLPPDHEGFATRRNAAALSAGLRLRPWQETLQDTLADERRRGLGRGRKAGLSPDTERRLLQEFRAETQPA